ncbi:MAG TPA: hypothetical protein VMG38_12815 [Trebonia sp.]|nr:hypothetical protein [Trebonia sp.]
MGGLEGLLGVQRPLLPGCFRLGVAVGPVATALAADTGDGGGDPVSPPETSGRTLPTRPPG